MTTDIVSALLVNAAVFSVLFLLMLPLRALLKSRASALLQYALWAVVLVKLMLPFGFESALSPLGWFENQKPNMTAAVQANNANESLTPTGGAPQTQPGGNTQALPESQAQQYGADIITAHTTKASSGFKAIKPLPWTDWALMGWALGALAVGGVQALCAMNLRRRALRAQLELPERIARIADDCARELGIKRRVRVVLQSALKTPAAMGALLPLLVLPGDVETHSDERIRHICLHELTHIKHGDLAIIALMGALRAVYWFNPLTWLCFSLVRRDMEAACDSRVLRHIGTDARRGYIGTVLHFAGREKEARRHMGSPERRKAFWGNEAAMGMADGRMPMEQRIRAMFRRTRTGRAAKAVALCMAAMMLAMSVLTACQPTPETPVVAGKNDGVLESALAATPSSEATPYEAPERLTLDIDVPVENYSIVFDAEVIVPDQTAYPVYTVEQARFTQEQADVLRLALLDGVTLYKPGEFRSREEIQRSIDSYEGELQWAVDEGYQQLIDNYTEILKELYAEYARTPENLTLEEADTTLQFHEEYAEPWMYGGKEDPIGDDGYQIGWTDEARQKAIDAGCASVGGVCWMDSGRKMEFSVRNEKGSTGVSFGFADGNAVSLQCNSCTLDQAIAQGNALLEKMGMDFSLVCAETATSTIDDNGDEVAEYARFHTLTYKRNVPGVPLDNIQSTISQNLTQFTTGEPGYSGLVPYPEAITIGIDDLGLISFHWSQPLKITATESVNVPLISFDEISSRIASQIKIQTMWDEQADAYEAEWVESRRLEVNKIVLSYLVVAKANDFSSFYYIPVWNVCGDLYYHYKDSYLNRSGGGYILDQNNERIATRQYRGDTSNHSLLTLSAIDGTVIPRGMHT